VNVNENMRAAFLHVLGDALGSIGVIISGLVIKYGSSPNRFIVDPLCSLFIVLIIAYSAIPQLIRVTKVVMQFVPEDIDSDALLEEVKLIDGIQDIHDFHVWQLDSMKVIATCHITCNGISEFNRIIPLVKERLHSYGVHSSSIQPELMQDSPSLNTALLLSLGHMLTLAPDHPTPIALISSVTRQTAPRYSALGPVIFASP
jgi:solute carrier family 30 (zinc transporter), member 1